MQGRHGKCQIRMRGRERWKRWERTAARRGSWNVPRPLAGTYSTVVEPRPPTTICVPSGSIWLDAYHRPSCRFVAVSTQSQLPSPHGVNVRICAPSVILHTRIQMPAFPTPASPLWCSLLTVQLYPCKHLERTRTQTFSGLGRIHSWAEHTFMTPSASPPVCTSMPFASNWPDEHHVSVNTNSGRMAFEPGVYSAECAVQSCVLACIHTSNTYHALQFQSLATPTYTYNLHIHTYLYIYRYKYKYKYLYKDIYVYIYICNSTKSIKLHMRLI